jgi:hypothetical protein
MRHHYFAAVSQKKTSLCFVILLFILAGCESPPDKRKMKTRDIKILYSEGEMKCYLDGSFLGGVEKLLDEVNNGFSYNVFFMSKFSPDMENYVL